MEGKQIKSHLTEIWRGTALSSRPPAVISEDNSRSAICWCTINNINVFCLQAANITDNWTAKTSGWLCVLLKGWPELVWLSGWITKNWWQNYELKNKQRNKKHTYKQKNIPERRKNISFPMLDTKPHEYLCFIFYFLLCLTMTVQ